MALDPRLETFRLLLAPLQPGRLLDVATGHGKFALLARDLGWKVVAMDARTERMPMQPDIEWIQSDIRSFPVHGYDCISILGLLYHLEADAQIDLLRRCAGTPTILDTHFALQANHSERGYEGRLFQEIESDDPARLHATPTASWGNTYSFWPTVDELIRMLHECGYNRVFKLTPNSTQDRTFFWCL